MVIRGKPCAYVPDNREAVFNIEIMNTASKKHPNRL